MGACSLSWLCRLIDCSLLTQTDVKVPAFWSLSLSTLCCTVASIRSRLVQILHEGTDTVSHHPPRSRFCLDCRQTRPIVSPPIVFIPRTYVHSKSNRGLCPRRRVNQVTREMV